ncbi:protein of unknown function (plasmid) [Thermococcus nautili]|uniref:hypothetical protein n=1 Tax=Thermococcus nautili TaxID=195522 RepID=UPI002557723F|nr:hypothetical protein [Thermococcus nautili]CAI1494174.1 protein of unknown function [Thermococcus nautili]
MMEMELLQLLRSSVRRNPREILVDLESTGRVLTPIRRRNLFLKALSEARKRKEEWEFKGFILPTPKSFQRKHPAEAYFVLSPLRASEQAELRPSDRVYLLLKIPENVKVPEGLKFDDYVAVRGFVSGFEMLPTGTGEVKRVDVLHTLEIRKLPVEDYWAEFREYALSQREILDIFENTFLSEYNFVKAIIYGLLGSPYVMEYNLPEGFSFGVFQNDERTVSEFLRAFNQFAKVFPKEFLLTYLPPKVYFEELTFGLHHKLPVSKASYEYYFNKNRVVIKEEIPLPDWVKPYLFSHRHSIYSPKLSKARLNDSFAEKSEVFWTLSEGDEFEFEIHRELKSLATNLLISFAMMREEVRTVRVQEDIPNIFRAVLGRLLRSYGYHDVIYNSDVIRSRYKLGVTLWGASYRFEGDKEKALKEFRLAVEEMLERWLLSLDEREIREMNPYRGMRIDRVLKVLKELEAVYQKGVPVEALSQELSLRGVKNPEVLIDRLLAEGFAYSPVAGRIKSIY